MKRNMKIFSAALALVLVFGAVVGGTLAWLMDKTGSITNVFTYGNVDISLWEHDYEEDSDGNVTVSAGESESQTFTMIPGKKLAKDPTITLKEGSEACWLFVKVEELIDGEIIINPDTGDPYAVKDFIDYSIDTNVGWTQLESGVYYYKADKPDSDTDYNILTGKTVTVKDDVTKEMMELLKEESEQDNPVLPSLKFTAYAVQSEGIGNVNDAWIVATGGTITTAATAAETSAE